MTNQKTMSKIYSSNRDGVTLLFVISMVVLFLLMGTTFMVVSNDYYKSARRRSRVSTNLVDASALLDRSFYQLLRGPDLDDAESPLRGHSILADQYGYGILATLEEIRSMTGQATQANFPVVELMLSIENGKARRMLDDDFIFADEAGFDEDNPAPNPLAMPVGTATAENFFNGRFNGRVVSIVDGSLAGYSGRIISSEYFISPGATTRLKLHVLPDGPLRTVRFGESTRDENNFPEQLPATVIINGRDFSGLGSGDLTLPSDGLERFMFDAATNQMSIQDTPNAGAPLIGAEAFKPNRFGDEFSELVASYLLRDNSPNEPYDIADHQNMFLSGVLPSGDIIPSFHRDRLFASQHTAGISEEDIRKFSFRPVYIAAGTNDSTPTEYSTANEQFPHGSDTSQTRVFDSNDAGLALAENSSAGLEVDSDNDGENDAIWIDIGLPSQTNAEGRSFQPMVAYRVIDLDNRLNLNAHGSPWDASVGARSGLATGGGYGVAEISLAGAVPASYYDQILDQRYGRDNQPGYAQGRVNGISQKLFGYPFSPANLNRSFAAPTINTGTNFSMAADLLGEYAVVTTVDDSDAIDRNMRLPGFITPNTGLDPSINSPYNSYFTRSGGIGESFFTAVELEGLLRSNDYDTSLSAARLNDKVQGGPPVALNGDLLTSHSFEVNMPATGRSFVERLNDKLIGLPGMTTTKREQLIRDLTPREIMFGGKLNLNRYFGNGQDDDSDGIVDEPDELANEVQRTRQSGGPVLDATRSRYLLAKDLYITFLLICGDQPPPGFMYTGAGSTREIEYHRMVAQWAVNIVDFRDPDSINTKFRFDPTPFDGKDFEVEVVPSGVTNDSGNNGYDANLTVWGCERPEILISETFAYHDRKNIDGTAGGGRTADGDDDDWDSLMLPNTGAIIEFYNPWLQSDKFQNLPLRQRANSSVNLGAKTSDGAPVWRVGLKRERTEDNADILRTIFFVEPDNPNEDPAMGTDSFFPSSGAGSLAPGQYAVMKPFSETDLDLTHETVEDIEGDVDIVVDKSENRAGVAVPDRALTITDPQDGYVVPAAYPVDQPLDARVDTYRTREDLLKLWVNGIADNFRYIYLQRLADPTRPFEPDSTVATYNPYLTVDTAAIDVLCMNTPSMAGRDNTGDNTETGISGRNLFNAQDTFTEYRSVERGASYIASQAVVSPTVPVPVANIQTARRNFFRAEDGPTIEANGYNATAGFAHTFGEKNQSYREPDNTALEDRVPLGWLSWNNRPFASHMELLNIPYTSPGMLTYLFNTPSATTPTDTTSVHERFRTEVAANYSNPVFGHLLRFSTALTGTPGANRFAHLFEFVETPSLFLGMENFLSKDAIFPNLSDDNNAEFDPGIHGIPNFRVPGKININTVTMAQAQVWNNLLAGFPASVATLENLRVGSASAPPQSAPGTQTQTLGTNFEQPITTIENTSFTSTTPTASTKVLGRDVGNSSVFDSPSVVDPRTRLRKDPIGSSYFANELKQKVGNSVTTRSSVFAIWITIGYFELDEFGRLGAEVGSEAGEVDRNRAFYIIDRSIPVAFEPGKNHNVDNVVIAKTIIE